MTTKPIRVGGDFGNSQSTLAIPAGRGYHTLTIPSFLGRGSLGELQRMRRGGGHSVTPGESTAHDGVLTSAASSSSSDSSRSISRRMRAPPAATYIATGRSTPGSCC